MRTIRNLLLGGLVCLASAAAQAGQSTPAERQQTRQLNLQAAQSAGAPVTASADSPSLAPVALNSLSNPPSKIANAEVVDEKGLIVGAAQKVEMDQSGKPTNVEIALLGSDRIIVVDSAHLSYDQPHNLLTASLDKNQIALLPVAPPG